MRVRKGIKRMNMTLMFIAALIGAGCGKQNSSNGPPQGMTVEVAVVNVKPEKVILTSELQGRTSAYLVAEVRPQASGIIEKRLFKEGADVKAGQVLYQIDPAPFQAAYDNAKAALGRAEASLPSIRLRAERYRELLPDKAVSQQEYDDAAASLRQAEADIEYYKAAVETARINLDYTRVIAPISGRISRSNVTDGALVTAQQTAVLATIQQLDPIYADIPQSTSELLRLRRRIEEGRLVQKGADLKGVKLILEDGSTYPLEGTLQFREITVDPTTGSVILRIIVPNPECVLLPGMFVRALVPEGIAEKAILAPQQGVSRNPKGEPIALIVDQESKVQQRVLVLDRAIGDKWLVESGLAPGDRVIVEGMMRVKPGAVVKAVPFTGGEHNGSPVRTKQELKSSI